MVILQMNILLTIAAVVILVRGHNLSMLTIHFTSTFDVFLVRIIKIFTFATGR